MASCVLAQSESDFLHPNQKHKLAKIKLGLSSTCLSTSGLSRIWFVAILAQVRTILLEPPLLASLWRLSFLCRGFVDLFFFVTSGDATSQVDFRRGSLPSVVATVAARSTPTVQWPHSRRNVSAVDHQVPAGRAKGRVLVKPRVLAKVPTSRRHATMQRQSSVAAPKQCVPMSPDQVVEAARSRVAKLKQVVATLGERGRHVPCRP